MQTKLIYLITVISLLWMASSCVGDLDTQPLDSQSETPDVVYSKEENYLRGLMKIYSMLALSGQDGTGSSDIEGLNGGNTQLYRTWWNLQEVSTDEVVNSWPDDWVPEINEMKWTTTQNEAIEGLYQRCMYMVAVANEYLKQTTDENMSSRGMTSEFMTKVHGYRAEAHFMRALAYYMLLDAFRYPPFITEENYSLSPSQIEPGELFDWIETELKSVESQLPAARTAYGRADKAVVNFLLARLYLNAEIYTGTARYTECITACKAVLSAGYSLGDDYSNLFKADNSITSASEIVFPIVYDGLSTTSFGGIRFLICASRGTNTVSLERDGVQDGWGGNRALPTLIRKFDFADNNNPDAESILDKRGIFDSEGRTIEVDEWLQTFDSQGWNVYKYKNVRSDGTQGSNAYNPDTDIPFFRLAEIYLTYAEAVKRGGSGGDMDTAAGYINQLRARGYGAGKGQITAADLTLDFILDERVRELYWEAVRRTDLIRYGYYTSNTYL